MIDEESLEPLEKKALELIAEVNEYDLDNVGDWLKARLIDELDKEMTTKVDGPMLYGPDNFEVIRHPEVGRWWAVPKEGWEPTPLKGLIGDE